MIDAGYVKILSFSRGDLKVECLEGSYLRHEVQKERQDSGAESRTPVSLAPLPLIVRPGQIVAKFACIEVRGLGDHFFLSRQQRYSRHLGEDVTDRPPESSNRQILVGYHVAERNAVRILERPLQQRF